MLTYVLVVALVIAVVVLIEAERRDQAMVRVVSKLSASTLFVALAAVSTSAPSSYTWAVTAALVLSWVGDACLLSKRDIAFLGGLGAFLLGHVGFVVAFVLRGVDWTWVGVSAVGLTGIAVAIDRWLIPQVEAKFRVPVRVYIVVITAMASLAFGCLGAGHTWLIPFGAVAFFLSDITVARDRFVADEWINRLVGLPLYYGAQLILAITCAY